MKKILLLVFSFALLISLTACEDNKDGSTATGSDAVQAVLNSAKADIKYPNLLSDELATSKVFQKYASDENSAIIFDFNVVTSPDVVEKFMADVEAGKDATLNICTFWYLEEDDNQRGYVEVLENKDGILTTSLLTAIENEITDINKDWQAEFVQHSETVGVAKLELKNGVLYVETDDGCTPNYYVVFSEYDLFENYDKMVELSEKYISPIYMLLVLDDVFDDMTEIEEWMVISNSLYREEGIDMWEEYSDCMINLDDFLGLVHKYFDVEDEEVVNDLDEYLQEDGKTLYYIGGYGGAFPEYLVSEVVEDGNLLHLTCLARSTYDWQIHEEYSYILTVELAEDGSFKYKSLKKL